MPYSNLLTHRATIKRRDLGVDDYGQPRDQFTVSSSNVPCRFSSTRGGERFNDRNLDVVVETVTIHFLPSADIQETDRLTVTSPDGTVLTDDANIQLVRKVSGGDGRVHHQEVSIREQRDGTP